MERPRKKSNLDLTYKTLFVYGLMVLILLIATIPILAHGRLKPLLSSEATTKPSPQPTLMVTETITTSPKPAVTGAIPASYKAKSNQSEAAPSLDARQLSWKLTAQAIAGMPTEQSAQWLQQAQAIGWLSPQGVPTRPDLSKTEARLIWGLVAQATANLKPEQATEWLTQADNLGWLAVPPATLKDFNPPQPNAKAAASPATVAETTLPMVTPPDNSPISIYPNNALEFNFQQVNSGRLAPYGVHWYSLRLSDLHGPKIKNLALTMFTTPSTGFIDSRVNFELFPGNQYHIWARGTVDDMTHFGLGMWLSRDRDDNTGEHLWSGSVVNGDSYFIKVSNNSPVVVDYYLFNGDINNAELGNPILRSEK